MGTTEFGYYLASQQSHLRRTQGELRIRLEQSAAKLAKEALENERCFAAARASSPSSPTATQLQLALPSGPRKLVNLSHARRRQFTDHLTRTLTLAASNQEIEPEVSLHVPEMQANASALEGFTVAACTMCGGGCCTRGANTAYLSASTLRRVLRSKPGQRANQLYARYIAALAPRTEQHSCIYHGAQGCGLPPELRSNVCHRFICQPLVQLHRKAAELPRVDAVIALTRTQDYWCREDANLANGVTQLAMIAPSQSDKLDWKATALTPSNVPPSLDD